jgi:tetratricopeptide (TPR) repeat protein
MHRIKSKLDYYQGKYKEALIEIDKGIAKTISNGLDTKDLVLSTPYVFRAMIFNALHKYQEALEQTEQLFEMHTSSKKDDHLVFGRIFAQKARAELGLYITQKGKNTKSRSDNEESKIHLALEDINRSITILLTEEGRNIQQNSNFSEDEDLAESYVIQGDIFYAMNKFKNAIDSYRKAQGIYFHLFKERSKYVEFVSYLYLQGAKASCNLQDPYYYQIFSEIQIKDFGHDHPNTIQMLEYCKEQNLEFWTKHD